MLVKRLVLFLLFAVCIWLALATRKYSFFPEMMVEYGGDVFWAAAFLFLLGSIFIKTHAWKLALICFGLGVLDEFSQLLQYDWIVAIRNTYFGRLILGAGFLWSDMVCYAIGTLTAFLVVRIINYSFIIKKLKRP